MPFRRQLGGHGLPVLAYPECCGALQHAESEQALMDQAMGEWMAQGRGHGMGYAKVKKDVAL